MPRHTLILAAVLAIAGAIPSPAAEAPRQTWIVGTTPGATPESIEKTHRTRPVQRFHSIDGYAVRMTADEAAALRGRPGVRWVEPEFEVFLVRQRGVTAPRAAAPVAAASSATAPAQSTPWGITRVQAPRIWELTRGDAVRVGVVDTGIDFSNLDFRDEASGRARLTRRPPYGYDFRNNDTDPTDDEGHGTHVAGTIAARDNAFGVIGVAPRVELHALKVLDAEGRGISTDVIRAIDWAIDRDFDVLNFSLGFNGTSNALREAVTRANQAGIVMVAATGNDFDDGAVGIKYPAGYPEVIAVGAIDETDAIAAFSQRGTGLHVVAPGVGVFSTTRVGAGTFAAVSRASAGPLEADALVGSPRGTISGPYVYSGLGRQTDFTSAVQGKIALISRGEITFNDKARNAAAAGATGVIIFNNADGPFLGTLIRQDANGNPISETFPVTVGITKADGEALRDASAGEVTIHVEPFDWANSQGTSMASPHVAGIAALLKALVPGATPAQIENAITQGARDVGPAGWDETFGWGIADAWEAARILAPELLAGRE